MIPWDDPKRDHGDAQQDFAVIAADVESRGLPKPGSSGNRQITIRNPGREYLPRTVYVGKRGNPRHHPAGQPWYIEWEDAWHIPESATYSQVLPDRPCGRGFLAPAQRLPARARGLVRRTIPELKPSTSI